MKQSLFIVITLLLSAGASPSQTAPSTPPKRPSTPSQVQQRVNTPFEVSEYGVDFRADPRLIVVMAALDAAGFDP